MGTEAGMFHFSCVFKYSFMAKLGGEGGNCRNTINNGGHGTNFKTVPSSFLVNRYPKKLKTLALVQKNQVGSNGKKTLEYKSIYITYVV